MRLRRRTIGSVAVAAALTLAASGTASGAVTARSATLSVPSFPVVSTTASCASGEHVSMAGFTGQVNDTQATFLTALAPTVTGVKVASGNPGAAGTITVTAYCDKPATAKKKKKKKKKGKGKSASSAKKKGKKKKKKKKPAPPPSVVKATAPIDGLGGSGSTTVTCPAGTTVRAGGFDTDSSADDTYHLTALEQISATQVKASVQHYGGTNDPKNLTAIALCGKGAALTASPGAATEITADSATSTATCASGKLGWIGYKRGPYNTVYATGIARVSDSSGTVSGYGSVGDSVQAIAYCG